MVKNNDNLKICLFTSFLMILGWNATWTVRYSDWSSADLAPETDIKLPDAHWT